MSWLRVGKKGGCLDSFEGIGQHFGLDLTKRTKRGQKTLLKRGLAGVLNQRRVRELGGGCRDYRNRFGGIAHDFYCSPTDGPAFLRGIVPRFISTVS